jgi:hypothetical protein
MSKVYAGLLVAIALIAMAAIGTLALVAITDVGYLAYRVPKPGMNPERGAIIRSLLTHTGPADAYPFAEPNSSMTGRTVIGFG